MTASLVLDGDYPKSWAAFVGQDQAKAQLLTAARSARKRKTRMDHTLLAAGTPGLGKTSLALLCAAEMRTNVRIVSGKFTAADARMTFYEMEDGDVLVIDEIHRMVAGGKAQAEWLLHYLQDGTLLGPYGPEEVPQVTIVGATTDAGKLPETLLDRFRIRPALVDYTPEEATKIAQGMAKRMFGEVGLKTPSITTCAEVAVAANFNPRVTTTVLTTLRDIALVHGEPESGRYDMTQTLEWLGLSADGLTQTAARYLRILLEDFAGAPAGASAMQDRLGEPGGLGHTERLLMSKGLIAKTKTGRMLTSDGIKRARALAAEAAA